MADAEEKKLTMEALYEPLEWQFTKRRNAKNLRSSCIVPRSKLRVKKNYRNLPCKPTPSQKGSNYAQEILHVSVTEALARDFTVNKRTVKSFLNIICVPYLLLSMFIS